MIQNRMRQTKLWDAIRATSRLAEPVFEDGYVITKIAQRYAGLSILPDLHR